MASVYPLGVFSATIQPGEPFELDAFVADIQLTGISFGSEVNGEARSSIKLTYYDRSNTGFGLYNGDMYSDSDEEAYSEADETDDDDDTGAVDEKALKKAMQEAAEKRKSVAAAAAAAGVSPKKLAGLDAEAQEGAFGDEEDDEEDDEDMSMDMSGELREVFLGNLLPGRIEQTPINLILRAGEEYEFSVTGENPVHLVGHYVEIPSLPQADYNSDSEDEDELSSDEEGLYDPETGLPLDGVMDSDDLDEEETDAERFQEVAPEAVPSKKEKKQKQKASAAHVVPAAKTDDVMDVDESAKAAPAAADVSAADISVEGLSKNQLKKLKKKAAQSGKPEVSAINGTKTEKVVVNGSGKTVTTTTEAEVTVNGEKATAKKASKKQTLPSGLVIEDVKTGSGPAAKKGQKVSMRYIGKLQDGKIFDSNTKGKAFDFKLGAGQVIAGWDQGIAGMQPGGERRLVIPAKLAYGKNGTDGIPGNATLTFEVKLLSIK